MMDVTMHLTNYALNKKRQATATVTIVGTYNAHAAVTRTSEWSHTRQRCSPVRLWPLHCTALPCGIGRRIAQGVPHVSVLQREFRVRGHRVGGVETLAVVGACRASVSALQHQSLPNRAMCWMPLTCGMQCIPHCYLRAS